MSGGNGAFKVFIALHMVDYASSHLLKFADLCSKAGTGVDSINRRLLLMGGLATAMVTGLAVGAMIKFGDEAIQAASKLEKVERQVKAIGGITPGTFKQVSAESWKLGDKFSWTTQAERLDIFRDLHNVFGDPKTARQMMPASLQYATAMKSLNPEVGDQEFYAAFKSAELTTLATNRHHTMSVDQFKHKLDLQAQMYAGTGGRVAPSEMLAFYKQNRLTATTLSDTGLYNLGHFIQELGGSRTGTELQAMARGVLVGRLGNASTGKMYALEAQRLGLLAEPYEKGKPVNFKGSSLFAQDPFEWTQKYLIPAFKAHGIDPNNPIAVNREASRIFGTQTAAGFASKMVLQAGQIEKTSDVIRKSKKADGLVGDYKDQYQIAQDEVKSSSVDLHAIAGKAMKPFLLPFYGTISGAMRSAGGYINDHPRQFRTSVGLAFGPIGALVQTLYEIPVQYKRSEAGLKQLGKLASDVWAKAQPSLKAFGTTMGQTWNNAKTGVMSLGSTFNRLITYIQASFTKALVDLTKGVANLLNQVKAFWAALSSINLLAIAQKWASDITTGLSSVRMPSISGMMPAATPTRPVGSYK